VTVGRNVRVDRREYLALPLEAHALLADVPLKDVSAIDLPGGGPGRTMMDLRQVLGGQQLRQATPAVRALFGLRLMMGRLFGWDRDQRAPGDWSYLGRVGGSLGARSLVPPGTADDSFHYLYVLPGEAVSEIRNSTVHAFICSVLAPSAAGYRLYWGVYVKPVSWLTPIYMALIEPFRRFIVYPAIFGRIRQAWQTRFPG
jgi:hypothetical protein